MPLPRRPRRGNVDDVGRRWRIPRGWPACHRGRWRVGVSGVLLRGVVVDAEAGAAAIRMAARGAVHGRRRDHACRARPLRIACRRRQRPRCGPGARPQPRDRARRCAAGDRGRERARAAGGSRRCSGWQRWWSRCVSHPRRLTQPVTGARCTRASSSPEAARRCGATSYAGCHRLGHLNAPSGHGLQ